MRVATFTAPDPADAGTDHDKLEAVAAVTSARVRSTTNPSFVVVVSNFEPDTVIGVPAAAIVALTLVIFGAFGGTTVNDIALVADPAGAVTFTVPVVVPAGAVTTSCDGSAEVTFACLPLNVTVSWLAVVLNPAP